METREIYARLNRIFQNVFDDSSIRVYPETTADDIEDWDSLEHINLIVALEEEFGMKFTMGEITGMKDVGESVDLILARATR